jgi:hypothetical protein
MQRSVGFMLFFALLCFDIITFVVAAISSDGTIVITDFNSTNGTCVGPSIESIMHSSNTLQPNTQVSVSGGDYISFGVCICRIVPERARTRSPDAVEMGQFEPSAFSLDQLRILKITMVRCLSIHKNLNLMY